MRVRGDGVMGEGMGEKRGETGDWRVDRGEGRGGERERGERER